MLGQLNEVFFVMGYAPKSEIGASREYCQLYSGLTVREKKINEATFRTPAGE